MQYHLFYVTTIDGSHEYTHRVLVRLADGLKVSQNVKHLVALDFWGLESEEDYEVVDFGSRYFFDGGERGIKVEHDREIPIVDGEVLAKYMPMLRLEADEV